MKHLRLYYLLILTSVVLFSSCGKKITQTYYKTQNRVGSALITDENSTFNEVVLNTKIDLKNWVLNDLSVSPDGTYLALAFMSEKLPRKGKLEIYRSSGTSLVQTFSDKALGDMIESSANITYPANVNAFIPYKLGYENNHILIVYIQPQRTGDATPEDAGLKINLQTNKASGTTEFFERTNRPPLPEHPSKKIYQFEVKNGEMFVNGQKLQKLPSGLDEDLHDEVTITK